MRVIYLHGFASGPKSRKARFFQSHLEQQGVEVQVPDLAQGDFESLTITSQLAVLEAAAGSGPVILVGSSMGGYLAALLAARKPACVERVVLLAPAFGFAERWPAVVGEAAMERWLATGKLPVFHYGEGRTRDLGLAMYQDSRNYPGAPDFSQPGLIFHGIHDAVVPVEASRAFAAAHGNVRSIEMDSDHELTDVMPQIWDLSHEFITRT